MVNKKNRTLRILRERMEILISIPYVIFQMLKLAFLDWGVLYEEYEQLEKENIED